MTTPSFVTAASVREYLGLNTTSSDSKYSDATIGSNIRAASWTLERATGRIFRNETALTLKFSTNGAAYMVIPGLRTATTVTLQGATLVVDQSYWLIPDLQQSGVSTGINLRAFGSSTRGGSWYLSNPEWWDRGLDIGSRSYSNGLPNDLVIVGDWGYTAPPEPLLHATKILAAYYTKRPDAILSGGLVTPDGNLVDLSGIPVEVRQFVEEWRSGSWVAGL